MSFASRPTRDLPLQVEPQADEIALFERRSQAAEGQGTKTWYGSKRRGVPRPDGTGAIATPEQPALAGVDPAPAAVPEPEDPLLLLDRELAALEADAYASRYGKQFQMVPHKRLDRLAEIVATLEARLAVTTLCRGAVVTLPAILPGALVALGDLYRPVLDLRHAIAALRNAAAHAARLEELRASGHL